MNLLRRRHGDNVPFILKFFDAEKILAWLIIFGILFSIAVNIYSIPKLSNISQQNSVQIEELKVQLNTFRASYDANIERIFVALSRIESKIDRHMERAKE